MRPLFRSSRDFFTSLLVILGFLLFLVGAAYLTIVKVQTAYAACRLTGTAPVVCGFVAVAR